MENRFHVKYDRDPTLLGRIHEVGEELGIWKPVRDYEQFKHYHGEPDFGTFKYEWTYEWTDDEVNRHFHSTNKWERK